jgi:NAD(P)-dependent dehydrogenase (short-subunit alcohol dehydrogenase family)
MTNYATNQILKGKTAIITGAGSGIGKCMIERFVQEGAQCLAADMNAESLEALVAGLGDYADMVRTFQVDVSDKAQVETMIDTAVKQFGGLDILVNNAGIMDNLLPIAEMEDDVWQRLLNVNLNSVMYGTRKAVQYFLSHRREGVIINTASLSGLCAGRGGCAYTTSKFAVVGLTKNVAFMYGDAGIRCNAICPGNTQTNIGVGMRQPSKLGMSKATTGYSGASRSGKPEEVAAAAVFLASGEAAFINGETLTIDGGWSAY